MKIGVLGTFYGCADLLPKVLEPWIALKNSGADIVLGAINAQFKEYADLGYANDDDVTRAALETNRKLFSPLIIASEPMLEKDARNTLLKNLLEQGVDIVWLLDGDELYTKEQIQNIISFVERTPFDYYHIFFDNRIFDTIPWKDNFAPPRIFRADRHDGIGEFTWDNELAFNSGVRVQELVPGMIPKNIAHVLHHTWRKSDAVKKIAYHQRHFGYSMYRLNDKGELDIDVAYFAQHGMPLPERLPDGSFAMSKKPILDVILRTHSTGNFREGARRLSDTLGGRCELSVRSLRSLVHSLLVLERANDTTIRLTVVDDHSDKKFLDEIEATFIACPFDTKLIKLEEKGNSASMRFCLEYTKEHAREFVYFVEDDYLHEPSALLEMMQSWRIFSRNLGRDTIGLFPVDYSDFYLPSGILPTRIVKGSQRHWRVSYSTTSTFFLPKSLLLEQWQWFTKNPQNNMHEDGSLNVVWQNYATLFSPIPTLAIHLHDEGLLPPFSNWRRLWDTVNTPLYEQH